MANLVIPKTDDCFPFTFVHNCTAVLQNEFAPAVKFNSNLSSAVNFGIFDNNYIFLPELKTFYVQ